jgi:hypothetical protein
VRTTKADCFDDRNSVKEGSDSRSRLPTCTYSHSTKLDDLTGCEHLSEPPIGFYLRFHAQRLGVDNESFQIEIGQLPAHQIADSYKEVTGCCFAII